MVQRLNGVHVLAFRALALAFAAAHWGSTATREPIFDTELTVARISSCPLGQFDTKANRYTVEPVTERVRAIFELREKLPGSVHCAGPLVSNSTFSFEAAHFNPEKDLWQGVLAPIAERLINRYREKREHEAEVEEVATKRTKDAAAETVGEETLEEIGLELPSELYDVCVVSSGVCVATLEPPPPNSIFDRFGYFTLRERTPKINLYFNWMIGVLIACLLMMLFTQTLVNKMLDRLYSTEAASPRRTPRTPSQVSEMVSPATRSDDSSATHIYIGEDEDEDESPRLTGRLTDRSSFADVVIPSSYEVVKQVVLSLSRMALAASTLIVCVCCFVFKREVNPWSGRIMAAYPIILMVLHMLMVGRASSKTLLYNALLRDKLHLVFRGHIVRKVFVSPIWLLVIVCTTIFLFTGLRTLIHDARTSSCSQVLGSDASSCSTRQKIGYVTLEFWGLLFPVAYCIWLLFNDFNFEQEFMPLYRAFDNDRAEEAPAFLGKLKSVFYEDFVWAADDIAQKAGTHGVTARSVYDEVSRLKVSNGTVQKGDTLQQHKIEHFSLWSWRLRMRHSKNKASELRLLLFVSTAALAWTLIAGFGATIYRQLCIPSIEELSLSIGQLSPEFDPYVFNYNIFVDDKVKSAGLEVIAEKEFTSETAFKVVGLPPRQEPWIDKTKNVHVPFLLRDSASHHNATQVENLRSSRRAAVPIELHVRGAGTTLVYRITVVKLETRVASLTYKYNTSRHVDEVSVTRKIDWEQIVPAEEVKAEDDEFADESEGAAVYVPEDTMAVSISMERQVAIFGPSGGFVVSGFEVADFSAARKLTFCQPGSCEKAELGGTQIVLDEGITAVPIELTPNGTDPLRFFVSIIRISNRLVDLKIDRLDRQRKASGFSSTLPFLPAFRPLRDDYETFFQVPEPEADGVGDSGDEDYHTLFFRVAPEGDARTNWLEAELIPDSEGHSEDLELFCRHEDDDHSEEPLDPTVETATKDLSCGALNDEVAKAENGEATEDLIIRSVPGGQAYKNHFYVRYRVKRSDPRPFTLLLNVLYHEQVLSSTNTSKMAIGKRTYSVKFLPQAPMRLEFFVPVPMFFGMGAREDASLGAALLSANLRSKRTMSYRKQASSFTTNYGLPLFLSPPFSSDVLVYDAKVPQGLAGSVLLLMMGSHSLWIESERNALKGLGRGAVLRQEIRISHGADCGVSASGSPAPAPLSWSPDSLCPVSIRIFERREGFPRTFSVRFHEAQVDSVLLIGFLHNASSPQGIHAHPIAGFKPDAKRFETSIQNLEWRWQLPWASPAPAAAPATASSYPREPSKEDDTTTQSSSTLSESTTEAPAKTTVQQEEASVQPTTQSMEQPIPQTVQQTPPPPPAFETKAAREEDLEENLASVVDPVPRTLAPVPRATASPTGAPRKMDEEALLPFLLQVASEPHKPDGIFAPPTEDDEEALITTTLVNNAKPSQIATVAMAPAPASVPVASPASQVPASLQKQDAETWETGESMPVSELMILAGSQLSKIRAQWNGVDLPTSRLGGAWWEVALKGRVLLEACWCDRRHMQSKCKGDIRRRAPLALQAYFRANPCLLTVWAGQTKLHEMMVGEASADAIQEKALEDAAEDQETNERQHSALSSMLFLS